MATFSVDTDAIVALVGNIERVRSALHSGNVGQYRAAEFGDVGVSQAFAKFVSRHRDAQRQLDNNLRDISTLLGQVAEQYSKTEGDIHSAIGG